MVDGVLRNAILSAMSVYASEFRGDVVLRNVIISAMSF